MASLSHLIYASAAREAFTADTLLALLEQSRRKNAALGVTGMLLFIDGSFFQVLEGEEAAVEALYERIERDPRHAKVTLIIQEPTVRRSFGDWTMGHAQVTREELASVPGLNDFFGAGSCLTRLDPGRAAKLLAAFAAGRWRARLAGAVRHQYSAST